MSAHTLARRGVVALVGDDPAERMAAWEAGAQACIARNVDFQALTAALRSFGKTLSALPFNRGTVPVKTEGLPGSALLHYRDAWRLDNDDRALIAPAGTRLPLSPCEGHFLRHLIERPGEVVNAEQGLWLGEPSRLVKLTTLRSLLCRLRRKVRSQGWELPVRNYYGSGYVFTPRQRGAGTAFSAVAPPRADFVTMPAR
jgi:DNA-binding response OmpR family regulator